jgi:hypothetical protein
MQLYFSEEDRLTRVRARDVRAFLVRRHHTVIHGEQGKPAPAGTDVWFHGLGWDWRLPFDETLLAQLLSFPGDIVLFQVCDAESMHFHRIPAPLAARTKLFLRNHWPTDKSGVPEELRDRLAWMPPMMERLIPSWGKPLADRSRHSLFRGTRTAGPNTLPDGSNARDVTVRLMRASGLPFEGGILPSKQKEYIAAPDLLVPKIPPAEHARRLRDTRMCLAPWGNHKLTYRLFEGLAFRCLAFTQPIGAVSFLDGGLQAGKHYVELAPDLSDLVEKVRYYLEHLDEAQVIADAGFAHYREFFEYQDGLPSRYCMEETLRSWGDLYHPVTTPGLVDRSRALVARLLPSLF